MSSNILYTFVPNVSAGALIDKTVINLAYLPISEQTLQKMSISMTDNLGRLIDLHGEPVTISRILKKKSS